MTGVAPAPEPLWAKLACPYCGGALAAEGDATRCAGCGARFPALGDRFADLLPVDLLGPDARAWEARQAECDAWYDDLVRQPDTAAWCLAHDYAPFVDYLAALRGDVLDVGGGNGVVREYLPPACRYVSVEPSTAWLGEGWRAMRERFACLREMPHFVRGIGERLPFRAASFDAVLSFWSLNHVSDPARVLAEVARVLRPGGAALLVLEDTRPTWADLAAPAVWRAFGARHAAATLARRAAHVVTRRAWPLQPDHIRIAEPALRRWLAPHLAVAHRAWRGRYLTYELRRA